MAKKLLIVALIIALVIAVPLARRIGGGGQAVPVVLESVGPRSIQTSVLASGRLVHEDEVNLSTEQPGRVTAIYVEEGDTVHSGQLVLQIDDERYRTAVEQREAALRMQQIAIERQQTQLDNLRRQWERTAELRERGLIDEDSFDTSTNNLRVAEIDLRSNQEQLRQSQAQLDQAEDDLRKTQAFSPIDGTVTSLDIEVGETAISSSTNVPGSSLMTIADTSTILTEVNVDEADIASIRVGQKADIFAIAYPDDPVQGVIESIALSAKVAEGEQGRSFEVKIRITDTRGIELRPGMSCRTEIFTDLREGALAVPIQAIIIEEDLTEDETRYYVYQRDGDRVRRVEVEVGISDDTYQEVASGLREGDEIVIGPDRILRNLEDGDTITVAET
ncbi:MAG TPA: efflux RND transporter periplasmic adaptor subunit [Gammaproteobacteria bacterium]|nr:efflux RND transporter periplasmic adaptor subunit [Gammaproteobacteria bacterium]